MKKMWALLISACILAGGVAGCGSQAEPQGTVTQKVAEAPAKQDFKAVTTVKSGQKNVYAVVKAMNGNYWKKVIAGMKKAGEENGVNVYVGGVNKDDNWELQRAMLIDAQAKKADSIILGAADSMRLTETTKNLRADKLPVVLVDTMMNTEDYDASYMTNNLAAGAEDGGAAEGKRRIGRRGNHRRHACQQPRKPHDLGTSGFYHCQLVQSGTEEMEDFQSISDQLRR